MVFKSVKSALKWFYDSYRGFPGSFDLTQVRVDKSLNLEMTELDYLASIGYYINNLSFEKQFILRGAYKDNLSDQEIGNFLNWELKVKNWNSKGTRRERLEAERDLREKLIEVEIITAEPKL